MKLLFISVFALIGAVSAQTTATPRPTVVYPDVETVLKSKGNYNTVLDLINQAGLMPTLKAAPDVTIFAPTDDAFAQVSPADLAALKADPQRLQDLLNYHYSTKEQLRLRGRVNDHVLISETSLPIRINVYPLLHITSAEGVKIVEKDIPIQNGFVHGLAKAMTPPTGDVVSIIAGRSDMSTLATLLSKMGLVDPIRADQNITVFAPTDAAFSKVSADVMSYLSTHDRDLKETLLYHVVNQLTLYSIGMRHSMTFSSADRHHDKFVVLEDDNGDVFINDAKVTEKDISATNGVIHVIDDVIIPIRVLLNIEKAGIIVG